MSAKEHIRQQLSAYLDGELNTGEAERLTLALQGDTDLRQELAELANVRTLLRSLPRERAGEDFIPCLLAEAERVQLVGLAAEEVPLGMRWARRLASAAVLLVAATIGVVIAMTLWAPPRISYDAGASRRLAVAPPTTSEMPTHPDGWASETLPPTPAPTSDADSTALADRRAGDTSTVDALAMLMKEGRAIDGQERGEGRRDGNGRDLPPPHLEPAPTDAYERELARSEDPGRFGRARGLAEAKSGLGAAPGGAGGGGAGVGGGATLDEDGRDRPKAKGFAGNHAGEDFGLAASAAENNEVIFTDRLDDTQRQVEKVLLANGIEPVPAKEAGISLNKARHATENFYSQNRPAAGQVQYEVFVTLDQMTRVQEGIHGLRAKQNVSQEFAFGSADGAESTRRGTQASHSVGKASGGPPASKFGLEDKAQDAAKPPQTKPAEIAEIAPAAAPTAAAPTTAPLASAKPGADETPWAMNLAKQESLFERRKETAEKDKAAEAAKKIPASPVVDPAAEETMAERADRKLDERPAPKAAAEPLVMAKPSSVAAPEAAAAAPAATPALPAAPAVRPAPRSGKEMPGRSAGAKVATEDVAQKAEQPASQPAGSSYAGGRFVANAPAGAHAKAGRDMAGWMDSASGTELGTVQPHVQPPATPAATTRPPAATAPAAAGGEAVVEVKVLNGQDVSPAKQTHDLAIATGGTMTISGPRQQPAPAATQASQGQAPSPSNQAGPTIQLVTRQRLGEGVNAQGEWKAQGAGTPSGPAETQANQTDQVVADQASVATQGKLNQRTPTGQTQEVSRGGMANQPLRQSTTQNAAARVQKLLITVNFRSEGQSGEPRPKAAAKAQTQDQRPEAKD